VKGEFETHRFFKQGKEPSDKNGKEIFYKKTNENMEENKEKKMKIKVNFKPYIPKINQIKQKQDTGLKVKKHQSSTTKNDTKVFIKLKDISLLTNPKKTNDVLDEDLECEGSSAGIREDLTRKIADSSLRNEPLDLSIKPQAQREDDLPLDLTKTKDVSLMPQLLSNTDVHNTSTSHHVVVNHNIPIAQIATFCSSGTITPQVICQPSIQTNSGPVIARVPTNSFIIFDNPGKGNISRRKMPNSIVSLGNDTQQHYERHGQKQLNSFTNELQEPILRPQLQKAKFMEVPSKTSKTLTLVDKSKSSEKKHSRTKQNCDTKMHNQIPKQEGMVKVHEKITRNGGVFCTFRNFTRSKAKHKPKTNEQC